MGQTKILTPTSFFSYRFELIGIVRVQMLGKIIRPAKLGHSALDFFCRLGFGRVGLKPFSSSVFDNESNPVTFIGFLVRMCLVS